jgi:hypothetical protein
VDGELLGATEYVRHGGVITLDGLVGHAVVDR